MSPHSILTLVNAKRIALDGTWSFNIPLLSYVQIATETA